MTKTRHLALLGGSTAVATVAAVGLWVGAGGATPFNGPSAQASDSATGCEHSLPDGSTLTVALPSVALHGSGSAPRAIDDSFSMPHGSSLSVTSSGVLSNDSDPEGDSMAAVLVATTAYGTLKLDSSGAFTYVPQIGFTGLDTFRYLATDGKGMSPVANVIILVGDQGVAGPTDTLPPDNGSGSVVSVSEARGAGSGSSDGTGSGAGAGVGTSSGTGKGNATAVAESPASPPPPAAGNTTVTVNIGDVTNTVTANVGGSTTTVDTTTGGVTTTVDQGSQAPGVPGGTVPPNTTLAPTATLPPIVIDYVPVPAPSPKLDEHGDDHEGDGDDDHEGDGDDDHREGDEGHEDHGSSSNDDEAHNS